MSVIESPYPPIEIPEDKDLTEFILTKTDTFGDKPCLICSVTNKTYRFSDLRRLTSRIASGLIKAGVRKGDRVCAILPGCIEVFPLSLGIVATGAIFTACNPQHTIGEIHRQLMDSEPTFVVTHESLLSKVHAAANGIPQIKRIYVIGECVSRLPSIISPFCVLENDDGGLNPTKREINVKEDVAVMFYSSGTSGLAKGVMRTHYGLIAQMCTSSVLDGNTHEDNFVQFTPIFHVTGYNLTLVLLYHGNTTIVMPRFDLQAYLQNLEKYRVRKMILVPPIVLLLAQDPNVGKYDLSNLNIVNVGAAPLSAEAEELLKKRIGYLDIVQGYGLTECIPALASPVGGVNKPGSVGVVRPNISAKVIDMETGATLGPNQRGELCLKGPAVMKGYWKNPKTTEETLDSKGWLRTGDIAYYDEDKYFYIVDRLKELIKYKGFQVPPAELEGLLLGHPCVADVCVIGVPNLEAGELPKAFVVLKPGVNVTQNDIVKYVKDRVSSYKRLRGGVEFVTAIPKTPSGKMLRKVLKDQEKKRLKSNI